MIIFQSYDRFNKRSIFEPANPCARVSCKNDQKSLVVKTHTPVQADLLAQQRDQTQISKIKIS
jgi:hypothetical protein